MPGTKRLWLLFGFMAVSEDHDKSTKIMIESVIVYSNSRSKHGSRAEFDEPIFSSSLTKNNRAQEIPCVLDQITQSKYDKDKYSAA